MTTLPLDHADRLARHDLALDGLSVGDAFGQQFFNSDTFHRCFFLRREPHGLWRYTDDTVMALGIREVLERHGRIEQDDLATTFARRFGADMRRGYGSTALQILSAILQGQSWREVSPAAFDGQGSMGNGGAMRCAPLGAYFADDLERAAQETRLSAEVTHANAEGQAGAIAIAVAAAWVWQQRQAGAVQPTAQLLRSAIDHLEPGLTRDGIEQAIALPLNTEPIHVADRVGNGSRVTAPDTVPFCLWCAARHLDNYPDAIWTCISVGGDIDTTAAIVGGIVALATGRAGIPEYWLESREELR